MIVENCVNEVGVREEVLLNVERTRQNLYDVLNVAVGA
jgi:hypothetical protein